MRRYFLLKVKPPRGNHGALALHGVVSPIGRLVQEELREKLDAPGLTLNWSALSASDLQGRARSFQSMVGGGMPLERAAALSGLMLPEDD